MPLTVMGIMLGLMVLAGTAFVVGIIVRRGSAGGPAMRLPDGELAAIHGQAGFDQHVSSDGVGGSQDCSDGSSDAGSDCGDSVGDGGGGDSGGCDG